MEFTLPAGALARVVGMVKGCVPSRTTIPVLQHVLITATAGEIVVRGTNLDMDAEARSGADVAADGAVAVPGEILLGIVKRWGKTDLATLKVEDGRAVLSCGRSRYTLRTLPTDDFPSAPRIEGGVVFAMPAAQLKGLFDGTRYAVCTDENQIYLNGVYLHVKRHDDTPPTMVAVASDNKRLGRRTCPLPAGADDMPNVIAPTQAVREIVSMLADIDGDVDVVISAERIRVAVRDATFTSSTIAGSFPNYEAFVPAMASPAVTIKPRALAEAVDRAFVVYSGTDTKMPAARFVASMRGLEMSAGVANMDEGVEEIDAEVHDRGAQFSVNARFLSEMLGMLPDVDVDIQVNGAGRPVMFTAKDAPEQTHIIMPQIR